MLVFSGIHMESGDMSRGEYLLNTVFFWLSMFLFIHIIRGGKMNAKHTFDSILKTSRGFQESRVLLCGAELDLFTLLAEEPLSAAEVAAKQNADQRGIAILLDALSALGYLNKSEGRYQAEPSAVPFLSRCPGLTASGHLASGEGVAELVANHGHCFRKNHGQHE